MMNPLAKQILEYVAGFPEGTPIYAKALLHLGKRAAVDQALARLVRRGQLSRAARGLYLRPVETRFGRVLPEVHTVLEAVAAQSGEVFTPHNASAANVLGLTTQVPVRLIYLTSGRTRKLSFGRQLVELRHAPHWQLSLAGRKAGTAIRALAWLGPEHSRSRIKEIAKKLSPAELADLMAARGGLPTWMAERISGLVRHA
jgi:hypothetical protein